MGSVTRLQAALPGVSDEAIRELDRLPNVGDKLSDAVYQYTLDKNSEVLIDTITDVVHDLNSSIRRLVEELDNDGD